MPKRIKGLKKCPECESTDIYSQGHSWRCSQCGRYFVKKIRVNSNIINDPTRPKCPECSTANPISKGEVWRCKNCGRTWAKIVRRAQEVVNPNQFKIFKI